MQVYPPAAVIFTGMGVLLSVSSFFLLICVGHFDAKCSQAAKSVSASQDTLLNVLGRIENFFRRLETYIKVPPTTGMLDIIVKIMVEVLSILSIATKEIKEGRASELILDCMNESLSAQCRSEKYIKKLTGKTDIEDALGRLDRLTHEEALMAGAQGLEATHDVDDKVKVINDKVEGVDEKVQGVYDKIQCVDSKVQKVDDKVQQVDDKVQQVDDRVQQVDDKVLQVNNKMQGVDDRVRDVHDKITVVIDRVYSVFNQSSTPS